MADSTGRFAPSPAEGVATDRKVGCAHQHGASQPCSPEEGIAQDVGDPRPAGTAVFQTAYGPHDQLSARKLGSLWIPDWSKRTTVGSTMTDNGTGSLFSTRTESYTTPLWLFEKANLRKISYQSGIHKEPKTNMQYRRVFLSGGSFFFTLVTERRRNIFSDESNIDILRQ